MNANWSRLIRIVIRERARTTGSLPACSMQAAATCIHCGLCTSSCPTYAELGDENDGPRGRIQLMRLVSRRPARR